MKTRKSQRTDGLVLDYAGWTDKIAGEQYPEVDGVYRV